MINLVVEVARHDYPNYWPSYLDDIVNLQSLSLSTTLAIIRTTVEEFLGNRKGISSVKSKEIKLHLSRNLGVLNQIIYQTLIGCLHIISSTNEVSPTIVSVFNAQIDGSNSSPISSHVITKLEVEENVNKCFDALNVILVSLPDHQGMWNAELIELLNAYVTIQPLESPDLLLPIDSFIELYSKPNLPQCSFKLLAIVLNSLNDLLLRILKRYEAKDEDSIVEGCCTKLLELFKFIFTRHLDLHIQHALNSTMAILPNISDSVFNLHSASLEEVIMMMELLQNIAEHVVELEYNW
jgi:hypothetical protein